MPRYDYRCDSCGIELEIERSMNDSYDPVCSGCNTTMSRVWQVTPAHFKGGGWGGQ